MRSYFSLSFTPPTHPPTQANEWEKHRVPLIEEYRGLRDKMRNKKDEVAPKLEEIKKMRSQMKVLAEDIKKKNQSTRISSASHLSHVFMVLDMICDGAAYKELIDYYKSLPKDVSRSVYTRYDSLLPCPVIAT